MIYDIHIYVYICIYIYIERERRVYMCIYIYIYIVANLLRTSCDADRRRVCVDAWFDSGLVVSWGL